MSRREGGGSGGGAVGRLFIAVALVLAGACGFPEYHYTDEADGGVPPEDGGPDSVSGDATGDILPEGCRPNGCGGCIVGDLARGVSCGTGCGTGTCSGTDVVCTTASPAPGTKCGTCGNSLYTCTLAGKTECAVPDDRVNLEDIGFKARDERRFVIDRMNEVAIRWKVARLVEYQDASVSLKRLPYQCARVPALPHPDPKCDSCVAVTGGFDCTVTTKDSGNVTFVLYAGDPVLGLTELARGKMAGDAVKTTMDWAGVVLDPKVPKRALGDSLTVVVSTDSSAYSFEIWGTSTTIPPFPAPPADLSWWQRTTLPTPSVWKEETSTDLALVVRGKACPP